MGDLAKMFIHCLNHWKLETPTQWKQHYPQADLSVYRMSYTRYTSNLDQLANDF